MRSKTTQAVLNKLRNKAHYHSCRECRGVYWDNCAHPEDNGYCPCLSRHGRPSWLQDFDPAWCCYEQVRPVTAYDLERYSLAGPGPWFQCVKCKRAHSFVPTLDTTQGM